MSGKSGGLVKAAVFVLGLAVIFGLKVMRAQARTEAREQRAQERSR